MPTTLIHLDDAADSPDFQTLACTALPEKWQTLFYTLKPTWTEDTAWLDDAKNDWHALTDKDGDEAVDWLIRLFNRTFSDTDTVLVRGDDEPEYFPKTTDSPARLVFAHGYFQSGLHEISHWCIAGEKRRALPDFGYWYSPDGRDAELQAAFEQVEIRPQAIECLFSLAIGRKFFVSVDNLTGDSNKDSTFARDVYLKACAFLDAPLTLPKDAKRLLWGFLYLCQPDFS